MKRNLFWALWLFFVLGPGCAQKREQALHALPPAELVESKADAFEEAKPTELAEADGLLSGQAVSKRMVHYQGYLKLKVTTPKDILDEAEKLADKAGGYVETRTQNTLVLRVPVEDFQSLFDSIAGLGQVLSRSLSAHDVTDAFTAVELRLKIQKASRDRLMALLANAKDSKEKLRLLKEIQRLTEAIDQLELQKTTLATLAQLSRITLEVESYRFPMRDASVEPIEAFRWIHELSPFKRQVAQQGDFLELEVPEGMVQLKDRKLWVAESPEGAVFWASEQKNRPRGSSEYWQEAILHRLGADYKTAEREIIGGYLFIRLVDHSETSYRYWIGVRATDDSLRLIEVYFPTAAHEDRYGKAIKAVITKGAP